MPRTRRSRRWPRPLAPSPCGHRTFGGDFEPDTTWPRKPQSGPPGSPRSDGVCLARRAGVPPVYPIGLDNTRVTSIWVRSGSGRIPGPWKLHLRYHELHTPRPRRPTSKNGSLQLVLAGFISFSFRQRTVLLPTALRMSVPAGWRADAGWSGPFDPSRGCGMRRAEPFFTPPATPESVPPCRTRSGSAAPETA